MCFGRHVNFARDLLHSYFDEPQKNEIHLLYLHFVFTSFLYVICAVWIKILKKSYKPTYLVITFNSRPNDMTSIERYVGRSTIPFIRDVAYA